MYTNREPEKNNAVSHKVWASFRAGFFASKTTGVSTQTKGMHGLTDISRSAESSWRSTFQTVQTTCLWSRESEVNNVENAHTILIQIHGRWTVNAQEVWSAKGFWCCNENLSPTNCSDNQSPTGRRSSSIICRPPNSSENHPKRVVVGGRREVVDVILWQPIADWRRSSTNICRPLTTSGNHPPKKWLSEVGDWLSL